MRRIDRVVTEGATLAVVPLSGDLATTWSSTLSNAARMRHCRARSARSSRYVAVAVEVALGDLPVIVPEFRRAPCRPARSGARARGDRRRAPTRDPVHIEFDSFRREIPPSSAARSSWTPVGTRSSDTRRSSPPEGQVLRLSSAWDGPGSSSSMVGPAARAPPCSNSGADSPAMPAPASDSPRVVSAAPSRRSSASEPSR